MQLNKLFTNKLNKVRAKANSDARAAGNDLKKKTKALYGRLAQVQLHALALNKQNSKQILAYGKKSQAAIKKARAGFNTAINTLTNKVTAHNKHFEKGLEVITGVIRTNKANGKKDRALIRSQNKALNAEMNTKITKFIQQGEAQAKAIADRARSRLAKSKKALLVEISVKVEDTADKLFKAIQGNHKKLADNYLSLKAYSTVASGKLLKYVAKGKGKNLSSIGDLPSKDQEGRGCRCGRKLHPLCFQRQEHQGGLFLDQDQRSRERVLLCHQRCPSPLASGSRKVPARPPSDVHARQGCPPGRQA